MLAAGMSTSVESLALVRAAGLRAARLGSDQAGACQRSSAAPHPHQADPAEEAQSSGSRRRQTRQSLQKQEQIQVLQLYLCPVYLSVQYLLYVQHYSFFFLHITILLILLSFHAFWGNDSSFRCNFNQVRCSSQAPLRRLQPSQLRAQPRSLKRK